MISELFDSAAWAPVEGFELTDVTYHRSVLEGPARGTVRIAFDRPEVRNAFRPQTVTEMIRAFEKGDHQRAREINARLIESYLFENSDDCVFSQSIKAMMRTLGLRVGECRLPLGPAPDGTEARAREVYARLHG